LSFTHHSYYSRFLEEAKNLVAATPTSHKLSPQPIRTTGKWKTFLAFVARRLLLTEGQQQKRKHNSEGNEKKKAYFHFEVTLNSARSEKL
jgi:hypothetical protein